MVLKRLPLKSRSSRSLVRSPMASLFYGEGFDMTRNNESRSPGAQGDRRKTAREVNRLGNLLQGSSRLALLMPFTIGFAAPLLLKSF
jgi:hypothetical protein